MILKGRKSLGKEAVTLYEKTGRKAQKWQKDLICAIMGQNRKGLWTHQKFGYSVPRRNGKTEDVLMRELWGLMNGERILHTAHRTTTSHATWEKLCSLLAKTGLTEKEDYRTIKQFGLERIEMLDGSEAVICFRTRSSKGGLGEGYDLLVIDEAQEYTLDQETALKYIVTDSRNPQTIFLGTPPTVVSAGTVFQKYREDTLAGRNRDSGWAEWSVDRQGDPNDRELWYEANPSLGTIFTERAVQAEIGPDVIDFNIQRLGLWLSYNQKSAIAPAQWNALTEGTLPELTGPLFAGVKYGKDGESASLGVAVRTKDGRIFVECIDCRPVRAGNDWILGFLERAQPEKVMVDGAGQQQLLRDAMKSARLREPLLPTVKEIIEMNAAFEQSIEAGMLCHAGQPALVQAATNCDKRPIGSNGGFGYKALREDVEIGLLDSVILAHWLCLTAKTERRPMQARY